MAGRSRARGLFGLALVSVGPSFGCARSSLVDLPLWRVETDSSGREVRMVELPYEKTSYDLDHHTLASKVMDRNQDGISDRLIRYEGIGAARTEETDTNFDAVIDRFDTYGPDGRRLRSASARSGSRPDRIATYDGAGAVSRLEIDTNFDGRFDVVRIYERAGLVEVRIDSDNNGRIDRIQDFRKGYLGVEDFDTDEDGAANLRMTYAEDGTLLKVAILTADPTPTRRGLR